MMAQEQGWSENMRTESDNAASRVQNSSQALHLLGTDPPWTVPECLELAVSKISDAIAVRDPNTTMTFAQLNSTANRLAHQLLDRLGRDQGTVLILLGDTVWRAAAQHGVVKAGRVFTDLNPTDPHNRLRFVLNDSDAIAIVTDQVHHNLAAQLSDAKVPILHVDALSSSIASDNPGLIQRPTDPILIKYTSGSTGRPKGVLCSHRSALHILLNRGVIGRAGTSDRCMVMSARWLLLITMVGGAEAHLFPVAELGTPALIRWINEEQVTMFVGVASAWRQLVTALPVDGRLPHLRTVCIGGESINAGDITRSRPLLSPDCSFECYLALSETGMITGYAYPTDMSSDTKPITVGYPLDGVEIIVHDENRRPAPTGDLGEIAVRSRFLASGYWKDPVRTAERFLPDPEDPEQQIFLTGDLGRLDRYGRLYHAGRKDFQIKIRGHRVELGEVEGETLGTARHQ